MKTKSTPYILCLLLFMSFGIGRLAFNAGYFIKPYMLITLAIFIYMITHRKEIFKRLYLFESLFVLFIAIVALSFIYSYYPMQSIRFTLGAGILLGIYLVLRHFFINYVNVKDINTTLANAGIAIGIINLIYYIAGLVASSFNFAGNDVTYYGLLLDRGSPRFIGTISEDPNIAAFFMSIFFLFFLLQKKAYFGKILFFLLIVLTFSRGAYIGIGIAIVIYSLLNIRQAIKFKILRGLISFVIMLSGSLYIINTTLNIDVISIASARFDDASEDEGSGRMGLWKNAIITFKDNPIIGIGENASVSYNSEHYREAHYVHNTYLEVLSELGIMGIFIYISSILLAMQAASEIFKQGQGYPLLLYLSIIMQIFFLSLTLSEIYALGLLIILVYKIEADKIRNRPPDNNPKRRHSKYVNQQV